MRDSIYRITLDMHDVASQVQIAVKQYDTARSLYITLMENGKPFQISEGCRAILSIASPESTVVVDDCEIRMKDSVIIYEFNNLTARSLGINECELKLYDLENDLLTSPKFTILVNENIFNDGGEHGIYHNLTLNRDKNDQHPISSITGLEEALESKTDDHDHKLLSLRVDNIESIISDKWDSTVTYAVDAYVIYDNALWKCKSQNSAQIPAEGDYWTKCSVSSEITGLSSEITRLSSEITGLSSEITGLSSDVTGLSSDVAALNSQMSASCTITNSAAFTVARSSISLFKHAGIVEANIILYIVSVEANNTISVGTVPDGYRPIANINIPVVLVAGTSIFGYGMLIINTSGDVTLRTNIAVSSSAPRVATSSTTYISA